MSPRVGRLRILPSTRTLSPPKAPLPTSKVNVSMPYDAHPPPSSPRLRPAPPPYAASSQPPQQPPSSYAPPPYAASYANHEGRPLPSPREVARRHRMGLREARQPLPLPMAKVHGGLLDQMSWHHFDQYVAKTGARATHSPNSHRMPWSLHAQWMVGTVSN